MKGSKSNVFEKFVSFGALARDKVKNDLKEVASLVRDGLLKKVHKKKRVFFELTESSLSLLNHVRLRLLEEVKLRMGLYPRRENFYEALLKDVRFLNVSKKEAEDFLFLGDWRLNMPPTKSQMELSQFRFYQKEGVI